MSARPFPPEDYAYPDGRNRRIRELEVALLETNDANAKFRECAELLADVVERDVREVHPGHTAFDLGWVSPAWLHRARAALARLRP
ncbi:MAG: hypothetical protein PHS14_04945 [Elusimicrobia bacterium]|nr:hypothetical protein [Elusimicrobiota bacterium]